MKRILFLFFLLMFLTGCGNINSNNVFDKLSKDIDGLSSYYLEGTMDIINNDDVYSYNVNVSYKKNDYYKVSLFNKANNHEQVILRNDDGVYVVTPNLNKSFKFQSDWPNNNSQVYLINSIISDIQNDKNYTCDKKDDNYIITSSVNYPNNGSLSKQVVYVDKDLNIKKVEVMNDDGIVQIKMIFDKISYNHKFDDNYFNLSNVIDINDDNNKDDDKKCDNDSECDNTSTTSLIDDIVYPLYLPKNTFLANQDKISTSDGERLILTFDGDYSFTLIEEVSLINDIFSISPVSGDVDFVSDVIAVVSDNSISWSSGNVDYYLVSNDLSSEELLKVARSISSLPVSK